MFSMMSLERRRVRRAEPLWESLSCERVKTRRRKCHFDALLRLNRATMKLWLILRARFAIEMFSRPRRAFGGPTNLTRSMCRRYGSLAFCWRANRNIRRLNTFFGPRSRVIQTTCGRRSILQTPARLSVPVRNPSGFVNTRAETGRRDLNRITCMHWSCLRGSDRLRPRRCS